MYKGARMPFLFKLCWFVCSDASFAGPYRPGDLQYLNPPDCPGKPKETTCCYSPRPIVPFHHQRKPLYHATCHKPRTQHYTIPIEPTSTKTPPKPHQPPPGQSPAHPTPTNTPLRPAHSPPRLCSSDHHLGLNFPNRAFHVSNQTQTP